MAVESGMANFKYFHDLPNGKTVELLHAGYWGRETSRISEAEKANAVRLGSDILLGLDDLGGWHPVTRKIEYKSRPSLHECDARCLNGQCNGKCECRCGGKNHGKGRVAA